MMTFNNTSRSINYHFRSSHNKFTRNNYAASRGEQSAHLNNKMEDQGNDKEFGDNNDLCMLSNLVQQLPMDMILYIFDFYQIESHWLNNSVDRLPHLLIKKSSDYSSVDNNNKNSSSSSSRSRSRSSSDVDSSQLYRIHPIFRNFAFQFKDDASMVPILYFNRVIDQIMENNGKVDNGDTKYSGVQQEEVEEENELECNLFMSHHIHLHFDNEGSLVFFLQNARVLSLEQHSINQSTLSLTDLVQFSITFGEEFFSTIATNNLSQWQGLKLMNESNPLILRLVTSFHIMDIDFGRHNLSHLFNMCGNLKSINVPGTQEDNESNVYNSPSFQQHSTMKTISVSCAYPHELQCMVASSRLERLEISYCNFCNVGFSNVTTSQSLRVLSFKHCAIDRKTLRSILESVPNLEILQIHLDKSSDELLYKSDAKLLAKCPRLRRLEFTNFHIHESFCAEIAENNKTLKELSLCSCNLTDTHIQPILLNCTLTSLNVTGNSALCAARLIAKYPYNKQLSSRMVIINN